MGAGVRTFTTNLRDIREHRQLGVRELARQAGVQPSTITRIEQGENPRLDSVVKIARSLNVMIDDLITIREDTYDRRIRGPIGEGKIMTDPRIYGPIGDAYARYDSDPRANGPDGFEAFANAVEPLANAEWGVYKETCRQCGKNLAIVATRHSVEHGYAEAFDDGQPICTTCKNLPGR